MSVKQPDEEEDPTSMEMRSSVVAMDEIGHSPMPSSSKGQFPF